MRKVADRDKNGHLRVVTDADLRSLRAGDMRSALLRASRARNVVFERRYAGGVRERYPELAAELLRTNVEVILAPGSDVARAFRDATPKVPVVFVVSDDPVATGPGPRSRPARREFHWNLAHVTRAWRKTARVPQSRTARLAPRCRAIRQGARILSLADASPGREARIDAAPVRV